VTEWVREWERGWKRRGRDHRSGKIRIGKKIENSKSGDLQERRISQHPRMHIVEGPQKDVFQSK